MKNRNKSRCFRSFLAAASLGLAVLAGASSPLDARARPARPAAARPAPAPTPAPATAAELARTQQEVRALKARLKQLSVQMEGLVKQAKKQRTAQSQESKTRLEKIKVKLGVLVEEVSKLRERLVLPATDKQKRSFGLGPSASKVYQLKKAGISFGGYGEFYIDQKLKDKTEGKDYSGGDVYRYIQYIGFKFNKWLIMNAEIEFEHATSGSNYQGKSGSISVEFVYLDLLLHEAANVRFGLMLIPMGFINELHEPPFYHGNLRPEVERQIIPSTWREMGVMVFGGYKGFSYKLWAVNGLRGESFSDGGWRSGRQKGGRILTEDWGGGLRMDYSWKNIITFGFSAYYGEADQSRIELNGDKVNARTLLVEGHVQLRYKGLEFRALAAFGHLSNARDVTLALFPDSGDPTDPETRLVAEQVLGYYVEAAFDFWPLFKSKKNFYLAPFVRFENYNTQYAVPEIVGRSTNDALNKFILDVGITFKPHPQVALKVNYREQWNAAKSKKVDALYFGVGFVY